MRMMFQAGCKYDTVENRTKADTSVLPAIARELPIHTVLIYTYEAGMRVADSCRREGESKCQTTSNGQTDMSVCPLSGMGILPMERGAEHDVS